MKDKILETLKKLRKEQKRNFIQSVDLIINLKVKSSDSISILLPHVKRKVCAFLEKPSIVFDYVITKKEIDRLTEKEIRKIAHGYDFFVALALLMPEIAKKFGKVLGSLGKMPDPSIGCVLMQENEREFEKIADKLRKTAKIKLEKSIKLSVGKENLKDEELAENAMLVYNAVINKLSKEAIKSVMLKLTMSKPIKV